jgi:hypothetical protein
VLNDERAKGFSMLYLLQIYGLVIISVALVVLALYLAALVSLLVIRSVHSLFRSLANVLQTHTAFWKELKMNRSKLHLN